MPSIESDAVREARVAVENAMQLARSQGVSEDRLMGDNGVQRAADRLTQLRSLAHAELLRSRTTRAKTSHG